MAATLAAAETTEQVREMAQQPGQQDKAEKPDHGQDGQQQEVDQQRQPTRPLFDAREAAPRTAMPSSLGGFSDRHAGLIGPQGWFVSPVDITEPVGDSSVTAPLP
ncbi:hypothetical protein GCM10010452_16690 [Crossiella cryophila]